MDITDKLNMTMLCDFYELTMGNGYLEAGLKDRITYFDIFFRDVPDHGGYAICAGLERIIAYIQDLHFSEEDIEYLRSKDLFSERFLDYLRELPIHRRHLGHPGGHSDLPPGADHHCPGSGYSGTAGGDLPAADLQPPEP